MLQITPQHRLLLAVDPVDFRKQIDGIASICKLHLLDDPFSGAIFGFTNRRKTGVKFITYDGSGFWLSYKRFSRGKLAWWPNKREATYEINVSQLQVLLFQGDPTYVELPEE